MRFNPLNRKTTQSWVLAHLVPFMLDTAAEVVVTEEEEAEAVVMEGEEEVVVVSTTKCVSCLE